MQKFVFFNAVDGQVQVSIDQQVVGLASTAEELCAVLMQNNVTLADRLMHSSDVDFASEEGFATDDCAHALIDSALTAFA
jgi:hypothetical protein